MAIKKSELYSSLWRSCDELRGGMDASQYKDYVLVLLFIKYVSDKAASQKNYLLDVRRWFRAADKAPGFSGLGPRSSPGTNTEDRALQRFLPHL